MTLPSIRERPGADVARELRNSCSVGFLGSRVMVDCHVSVAIARRSLVLQSSRLNRRTEMKPPGPPAASDLIATLAG
jgi:hypothetical protein